MASEFIPDYHLLPQADRAEFEETDAGRILKEAVDRLSSFDRGEETHWFFSAPSRINKIQAIKTALIPTLSNLPDYNFLAVKIELWRLEMVNKANRLYFPIIYDACENQIESMKIRAFNLNQAQILARRRLIDPRNSLDTWLPLYKEELIRHIKTNIVLIKGKDPLLEQDIQTSEAGMLESLSYLLSACVSEKDKAFLHKKASGFAALQASSFSTQNENSHLALFDFINTLRVEDTVEEGIFTISKLLQPFTPILNEYRNIAKHERNIAFIFFRTLMPMLIMAAVVIFVAALLTSFAIPEAFSLIILVPTIYMGLIAANSYIVSKDSLYYSSRQYWYGGQFEIPEYKINSRMEVGFKNNTTATVVRDFYIEQLKLCFETEKTYYQKTPGTLTESEIAHRKANRERKCMLDLEWFDVHSNDELGSDKILPIVLKRLQQDLKKECTSLKKELTRLCANDITLSVNAIADKIKTAIEPSHQPSVIPNSFFKMPDSKVKAERLNTLRERITSDFIINSQTA